MRRLLRIAARVWGALALMLAGVLVTVWVSLQVKHSIEHDAVAQFSADCDEVNLRIKERLSAYALILRGGVSLFAASTQVQRKDWKNYVEALRADGSVPGVQGIGFARVIAPGRLAAHIEGVRNEGYPDYSVQPDGERSTMTSVVYLEPFRNRNLRAFGFDMYSEPVRRAAMEQARDTGVEALSGKVVLMQETGVEPQAGMLMYAAVYQNGLPKESAVQRQAALVGWVYSPYRMDDLVDGILRNGGSERAKRVDLHIYDGLQATPDALLFESKVAHSPVVDPLFYQQRKFDFNGHPWLLAFDKTADMPGLSYASAWATLLAGLAFSGLLFGLMLSLINVRRNAARIARSMAMKISRREALLKESESRWKFAIDGAREGLWDWNVADGTVFFSMRWKEILGYGEDDIGNRLEEWERRIHPDDKVATLAAVQAYLEGETPFYTNEHRVSCKGGGYKWILDRGMVVTRGEDGKPLRVIGTHSDIDERKLVDVALRASEELKNGILDAVDAHIAVLDISGFIVATNEPWRRFGRESVAEPGTPALSSGVGTNYLDACQLSQSEPKSLGEAGDGILSVLRGNSMLFTLEYSCHSADRQRWFSMSVTPLGRPVRGAVIAHTDITARKQAQAVFQALFDQSSFLAGVLDQKGSLVNVNSTALKVIGASREDVIGMYFPDTPWWRGSQNRDRLIESLELAYQGVASSFEATHVLATGGAIDVEFSAMPIQMESGIRVAVIGVDATQRKKIEAELLRSNSELEQFSYGISHDMRQPLRMISSYLQLLEKSLGGGLDEERRSYFHFAIDGAKRLDAMLLGLLDYSRVGRKGEPAAWVQGRSILNEALLFLKPAIAEAQAQVHIEGTWPLVFVRPDELLRLLQNLIGNALKFRVAGRVPQITVSAEVVGDFWRLCIADNGIGILPDQMGRLFKVFQRLQSHAAFEGTGIGLALCRKIAEHHGGRVWVESEGEGHGSHFCVEFPRQQVSDARPIVAT